MHIITKSGVLFLWMHTLTFVKSQVCTLEQFKSSSLYDSHFDISDLEPSYASGKQVRVSCSVGFSGFFRLLCIEGKWQSKGSKCQPRSCGHPGDAQFADFHLDVGDDFVFGSQVVYTCHKGYQMVSRSNVRRCMAEGWDGVLPVCEASQCAVIHVDTNVQVIGDPEEATFGNVLRFSCKSSNEILIGSAEAYCDESGQWSSQPPTCKEITCPAPVIENGYVTQAKKEYKEHDILYFECKPKYKRSDDRQSKCTKVGIRPEWSPTPTCELIKCKLPLSPPEGTSFEPPYRNAFFPGDSVQVSCTQKYWIGNPRTTTQETTCKDNGEWTVDPTCREVTCSNQKPENVNSWRVGWRENKLGQTIYYTCNEGYHKPTGINTATCTRDGWFPNPLCEEVTCDKPHFDNINIDSKKLIYKYNEWVRYVCADGYEGSGTLQCQQNGWSSPAPCREVTCPVQDYPNAKIKGVSKQRYKYKEEVEYTCRNGGHFTLTCEKTGWTGSRECKAPKCRKPVFPDGFVVGPINETLYYACKEGYKLLGQGWWGEAKCDGNAFSGLCIEKTSCGPVPVIPNGQVRSQKNHYKQGEIVQITCDKGYSAHANLTCHKGKWDAGSSLKTICTPTAQPCSPPPRVENAVVEIAFKKEYLSDTQVTYQCRHGYTMEGENTIKCQDGKWEVKSIKCLLPDPEQ